jgi:hypothetical protein
MTMTKTHTRIDSTRRRARGAIRSMTGRANRLPVLYAKAWAKEMSAWTDLAVDVLDGGLSPTEAISGAMALSFSGLQTSVNLGRAALDLIIRPTGGSDELEFRLDKNSEAADPLELEVQGAVATGDLSATDLKNVDNPRGPSIPGSHVEFTTPGQPSEPVLVALVELVKLVSKLPDGTYEGKVRKGGVDIATIRAVVDN